MVINIPGVISYKTEFTISNIRQINYRLDIVNFSDNNFIFKAYELNTNNLITSIFINQSKFDFHFIDFLIQIINNSPHFEYSCTLLTCGVRYLNRFNFYLEIKILTEDFIPNISGIYYYIKKSLKSSSNAKLGTSLENNSYVPNNEEYKITDKLNKPLFSYQLKSLFKMINIEKKQFKFSICKEEEIQLNGINIPKNLTEDNNMEFIINTKGGVLADEMGLGKTLTSLSLINYNQIGKINNIKLLKYNNNDYIESRATLLLCPNHLAKQWEDEVKSNYPKLKVIKILTKRDHSNYNYLDLINVDIIIVTQQFLMNFKHYPLVDYNYTTPAKYNHEIRMNFIRFKFNEWIKEDFKILKTKIEPIFELFKFHRVFIDEGHEIFGENSVDNLSLSRYIANWIKSIKADNYWYVSGTPYANEVGFKNLIKFIGLEIKDTDGKLIDILDSKIDSPTFDKILSAIIIRHRKQDVVNQIEIPDYQESIIWVKQTDVERDLYNSKVGKESDHILQQMCCHPLIADSISKIIGNEEVNLDNMKDKLISHHKNNILSYTTKLNNLDPSKQEYNMLKNTFTTKITESKYILSIIDKMIKNEIPEDETCSVCFDNIEDPTLTSCGHLFCNECLKVCLKASQKCPMCKTNLSGKEIININTKQKDKKEDVKNPLIQKYGAKLGKLISLIRHITSDENNRIIVFSQWDNMLSLISKSLSENGVGNSIIKGNVWARNSAISKFKKGINNMGGDNKVIMLSLTNSASGTNLTEATHIFFVEPINASKEEYKAIEGQAIGRAVRLGQTNKVNIIRVLTKETIEEEIYNRIYKEHTYVEVEKTIKNIANIIEV
ncbi:putative superfamily II helicase [Chlorella virus XW01]|nr:putative superfamily II helicase [Chlorella virus XW01]